MRRLFVLLLSALFIGCSHTSEPAPDSAASKVSADAPVVRPWKMKKVPKGQANFLIIGDWGSDNKEQRMVAEAAAEYVHRTGVQFNAAISVGDNIYYDLPQGSRDVRFQKLFEDMYDARRLNMPFYMTLGNHDYDHGIDKHQLAYARENPQSRWKLPARWYRVDLPEEKPLATFLMLDSNRNRLSQADWAKQVAWLEEELARPGQAPWMICVAHHCMFSNGAHGDNGILQIEWGLLAEKHGVDFMLNGHDHDLQHLQVKGWGTSFILAGGGGRDQKPMRRDTRGMFSRRIFGFAHMRLSADRAEVWYINAKDGKVVHHFVRWLDGRVEVISTTPSDKADKKQQYYKLFDEGDTKTPVIPSLDPDPADSAEAAED